MKEKVGYCLCVCQATSITGLFATFSNRGSPTRIGSVFLYSPTLTLPPHHSTSWSPFILPLPPPKTLSNNTYVKIWSEIEGLVFQINTTYSHQSMEA